MQWRKDQTNTQDMADFAAFMKSIAQPIAAMIAMQDSRTYESFVSGAQQKLRGFASISRASQKMKTCSFRFADLKEGDRPTTVFLMLDSNKKEALAPALGVLIWGALLELRRHPNKSRDVVVYADEISNFEWQGLGSFITWSRAYSIKLFFVLQTYAAFALQHGEPTLKILKNESEIVQILPNTSDPETLKELAELMGERSVIATNHNRDAGALGIRGQSLNEESCHVMSADEIRRTNKTIFLLKNHHPMLMDLPSIAEIHPWRTQIGINPFHGKPYLKPIKLRIRR